MASPARKGRPTTITLYPEAFEFLQQIAPGPRQFGAVVSRLLVAERERQEARVQERQRIAKALLEDQTPVLAAR